MIMLPAAALIWITGYFHTGKYVRPRWKIPGKFVFYMTVSVLLIFYTGYFSLIFIIGHPLIGLIFHIRACRKHKINWVNCQPVDRYIELQEKWAGGDFN